MNHGINKAEHVTDEPEARVDLLARNLAKNGTVFNTLAASCDVSGQVLAVAPNSGSRSA